MDPMKRTKPHWSITTQEEEGELTEQKNRIQLQNPGHEEKGFDGHFILYKPMTKLYILQRIQNQYSQQKQVEPWKQVAVHLKLTIPN